MSAADNLSSRNCSNNSGTANSMLPIFSFLMAVFLVLMTLKFLPLNTASPFETHGLIMLMFVITILVYTITFRTSYFPEFIDHINFLSGSLSPVLLALILFPRLGRFILLIWFIYFVKLICVACQKLYQLYKAISSLSDLFNQLLGRHGHHEEERIRCFTSSNNSNSSSSPAPSNHRHAILGFPITVLLALMAMKFHSMNIVAPFETHSAVMSMFVIATVVYAVAWAIEAQLETDNNSYHKVIVRNISLLSGSLATVLLVLVIVPALGWFILLVWILYLVKLIYDACQKLHQLYQAISSASDVFNKVLRRGGHQIQGRIGLPV